MERHRECVVLEQRLEQVGLERVGLEHVALEHVGLEHVGLKHVGLEHVGLKAFLDQRFNWLTPMYFLG